MASCMPVMASVSLSPAMPERVRSSPIVIYGYAFWITARILSAAALEK